MLKDPAVSRIVYDFSRKSGFPGDKKKTIL